MQLSEFRDLLANDGFAATFQTMGQYRTELLRALDGLRAQADARPPLFYYRPVGEDGLYEGPVHANSVSGKLLRDAKPGEWKPLYTHPEASAPGLSDEQLMRFAPATPKDFLAQAKKLQDAILTRASAATVPSFERRDPAEELAACQRYYAATVAEPSEDAKRLENIVAIGWEGLRKAWERFGEDHECETALEEIRAVIDADRAHPQAAQQQAEPMSMQDVLDLQKGRHALRPKLSEDVLGSIDKFGDEPTALFNEQQAEPGADERSEVDRIACVLLEAFQQAEPFHVISKNPQSYLATFADMARAALAAQSGQRAGVAETAAARDVLA